MTGVHWVMATVGMVGAGLMAWLFREPLRRSRQSREADVARLAFQSQREALSRKFLEVASLSGKPRGLRWLAVDFGDEVRFARDRQTGLLAAFVGVNIRFEAIPGGDMDGVAAVGNIRDGAALFHYERGGWGTGGRTLFNVGPAEALARFQAQFEPLSSTLPA
jgi:hypothetical protein